MKNGSKLNGKEAKKRALKTKQKKKNRKSMYEKNNQRTIQSVFAHTAMCTTHKAKRGDCKEKQEGKKNKKESLWGTVEACCVYDSQKL